VRVPSASDIRTYRTQGSARGPLGNGRSYFHDPKLDMRMTRAIRRKEESHAPAGAFGALYGEKTQASVGGVAPRRSASRRERNASDWLQVSRNSERKKHKE